MGRGKGNSSEESKHSFSGGKSEHGFSGGWGSSRSSTSGNNTRYSSHNSSDDRKSILEDNDNSNYSGNGCCSLIVFLFVAYIIYVIVCFIKYPDNFTNFAILPFFIIFSLLGGKV